MSARKRERVVAALTLSALLGFAPACEDRKSDANAVEARTWPEGTALAIDGRPISQEELDEAAAAVQRIEPSWTTAQLLRLGFSNIVLPRAVCRALAPAARDEALAAARGRLDALRKGTYEGSSDEHGCFGEYVEGTWQQLGIAAWHAALELEEGAWSEPIEDAGAFVIVRRLWLREGPVPAATVVAVDAFRTPFVESATLRQDAETAIDDLKLEIVDPAWREIVPELIQHRMGARR